ncbi:MAG: hypothetical protein A2Z14_11115 [Chloroflexi bacterium RBG_16_48_8]|nr:MAG: hypothetical protein A2Z14_11115 [Chloroflexi bacterium RBG_16_48_8]
MQWYTAPASTIGAVQFTEEPYITPTSPFEVSPPPSFLGADSLNCIEPYGGDSKYGYCRIPGTLQYYVWGECTTPCPDSEFGDVEVLILDDSTAVQTYITVINDRDKAYEDRFDGFFTGGVFGAIGVAGGAVGLSEVCIVSGSWNGGTGCVILLMVLGTDAFLTGKSIKGFIDANDDLRKPNGLNDSVIDLFEIMRQLETSH